MSRDSSSFEDAEIAIDPKGILLEAAREGRAELISGILKSPALKKDDLEAAISAAAEAGHPKVIAAFKDHIAREAAPDLLDGPQKSITYAELQTLDINAKMKQAEEKQAGKIVTAAKEGNIELISEILSHAELSKEKLSETIDAAAQAGHPQVLGALKDYIQENNSREGYGDLSISMHEKLIMARGNQEGRFFEAIKAGKIEDVEYLLHQNPELSSARNSEHKSPEILAAEFGHREILERLVPAKEDRERKGYGYTPSLEDILKEAEKQSFLNAARNGNKTLFDRMLAENPDFATATDKDGKTALHLAAEGGQKEILTKLLEHPDASVMAQAKDSLGRTPLHYAAENGKKEMCDVLIESASKGGTPEQQEAKRKEYVAQQDVAGRTADHLAANNWHNTRTTMPSLGAGSIQDGSNLNAGDLARAAVYRADIMKGKTGDELDIKRPELLTIPDKDGKNALHFAAQHQNQEALDQILQHENVQNAINVPDKSGKTPLIYAAETGNQALYETLVKAGANTTIEHEGKTAEAILAEAAKRAEEERARKEREASAPPDLLAKMAAQAPKAAGSDSKDKPLSQEDFFAGHVERLPYQPGEPCKNGEDKFKFDPQTRTTSRAMSDPTKSHVMETANPDGSFKYDVKTVAPDDSPTKIHKIEGDFGTLYFDAKGAMIGAELSPDLEKLKKLDPAQRAQAEGIMQEKLVREEQSRSSGAKSSSIDAAESRAAEPAPDLGTERKQNRKPSQMQPDLDDGITTANNNRDSTSAPKPGTARMSPDLDLARDSSISEYEGPIRDASTHRAGGSMRDRLSSDRGSSFDGASVKKPLPKSIQPTQKGSGGGRESM